MINTVRKWMDRYFAEEEAVILLLLLALGLLLIATLGDVPVSYTHLTLPTSDLV